MKRRILFGIALVLIGGTAVAQEGSESREMTAADRDLLQLVRDIETRVAGLREKAFRQPTDAGLYTRTQLEEFVLRQFDRELPPEKRYGWERAAKAFGVLPEETDMEQALLDLFTSQIAGFYDPETGKLYCISGMPGFISHMTMAHEILHALQDQYDDLQQYYDAVADDDDRVLARQCVVEGEAQYVTDRYTSRYASALAASSAGDPAALLKFGLQQSLAQMGASPYFIAILTFPYVGGARFVREVREKGGWEAVDDLYQNPPESTEQVIHPEKFLDPERRDAPRAVELRDLTDSLGPGWSLIYENRLGELQTEVFIRLAGDPVRAVRASYGWDGDRYMVYEHAERGDVLLQWRSVFDSDRDAEEMIDALRKVLQQRFGSADAEEDVAIVMDDAKTSVEARGEDGTPKALALRRGDRVLYLFGLEPYMDPAQLTRDP